MYKNLIINYAKNLKKEDLFYFVKNNNLDVSNDDIDTIYNYIKNNYNIILDDPLKHLQIIRAKVNNKTYNILLDYYNKYKKSI